MRSAVLLALALALPLAACDTPGPEPPPPGGDRIVSGVNLTRLFASPRPLIDAVRAEWADRDRLLRQRYEYTEVARATASDGAEFVVLAVRDTLTTPDGPSLYGLVRLPARLPGDMARRPLVLVLPDDGPVNAATVFDTLPFAPGVRDDYVHVVPVYRGQRLTVGAQTFDSPPDPAAAYDLDVDDALALFDHVAASEPLADPDEGATSGFGRGGAVALLAASRAGAAERFGLVVDLAGPTDLFLDAFEDRVAAYLGGGPAGAFPAFDDVADAVIDSLRAGAITMEEARLALLRRSPRYFVGPPPFGLFAHGELDTVVPVVHSDALDAYAGTSQGAYLRFDDVDHAGLPRANELVSTATQLLLQYAPCRFCD